ncbi:hypothetical protein [Desulforamulus ruminis]|uniref:Uncharacterized protein n=1 Tax=Desulforamulus ruminis (strain ATCC 23193 / DSM 2154 / NCIMB 8452 / DL) TaxID=696281 RepID=F6DT55_DESRL|nr:hypothetical protein [Desulforamulus ruminis]AEG61160.1 hypothetical protein Desru_2947 [Desulforamulus ruminis DSM 2154]
MQKKKILALILCFSFILSSMSFLSIGIAGEFMKKANLSDSPLLKSTPGKQVVKELNRGIDSPMGDILLEITNGDGVLYQGQRESLESGDAFKEDTYHIEGEELANLIQEGYSVSDIFKADELANKIHEEPKNLLKRKKELDKNWEEVEKKLFTERAEKFITKFKSKYPKESKQLEDQGFSEEEQFTLLAMYDQQMVSSIEELTKSYKQNGEEGLKNIIKNPRLHGKISKEKMDKYGLTEQDTKGLSEDMIEKMEMISQEVNVPVKELIKGYHAEINRK